MGKVRLLVRLMSQSWVGCDQGHIGGVGGGGAFVLVLVLVFIKDALTIKRMLTTRHPYTRDLFLYLSCKSRYRKCMLSSPPASLLPRYGRNRIRAGRRTKAQLKRGIEANVCLARRPCQNQFVADSQQ